MEKGFERRDIESWLDRIIVAKEALKSLETLEEGKMETVIVDNKTIQIYTGIFDIAKALDATPKAEKYTDEYMRIYFYYKGKEIFQLV